jgi:histidyl-tRNA synthetase
MIEIAGIEADKFKSVCSSIDKLDKQPWSEI